MLVLKQITSSLQGQTLPHNNVKPDICYFDIDSNVCDDSHQVAAFPSDKDWYTLPADLGNPPPECPTAVSAGAYGYPKFELYRQVFHNGASVTRGSHGPNLVGLSWFFNAISLYAHSTCQHSYAIDNFIFQFYVIAWCPEQTFSVVDNLWLSRVPILAFENPAVFHAMLLSSADYLLQYFPLSSHLQKRAAYHYEQCQTHFRTILQTMNLESESQQEILLSVGPRDTNQGDIKDELVKQGLSVIKQRKATHHSNPSTPHTDMIALCTNLITCRHSLTDLLREFDNVHDVEEHDYHMHVKTSPYQDTVHSHTGMSPRMINTLKGLTGDAQRLHRKFPGNIWYARAKGIDVRLPKSVHYSEWWNDAKTEQELMLTAIYDDNEDIDCSRVVVRSSTIACIKATGIYIKCRCLRLKPTHPEVQSLIDDLSTNIARLPKPGPLFTAQVPIFPVLILAVVASQEDHRETALAWLRNASHGQLYRSNIPMLLRIAEDTINFMRDNGHYTCKDGPDILDSSREPWWETMVEHMANKFGRVDIC